MRRYRSEVIPALVAFLVCLGGCMTVGPDYEPPEPVMPDAWNRALMEGFSGDAPALVCWWDIFGDPVLAGLIGEAYRGNLDLGIAIARIEEARALRGFAAGEWYPAVEGVGTAAATRLSEGTTPTLPPGTDREDSYFNFGLAAGWELDFWGRIRRSVESADASVEARVEDCRDTLVLLFTEVALSYSDVRTLQARIRYLEANVVSQSETVRLTVDRRDAGLSPQLDVSRAQLNLARTESAIPPLRAQLAQAIHRIGVLTGRYPDRLYNVLSEPGAVLPVPEQIAAGLPADLLRQRPDVRRAERELAAQHARIGVATADLYPAFSLPGSLSFESIDAGDLFDTGSLAYNIGPAFRWNLFTGGRVRNLVRAEEARTQQALLAYEQTLLLAVEEVENAMIALAEDRKREAILVRAVDAAGESADLAKDLYQNGLTSFQAVLDAERDLAEQQDALAETRGRLAKSVALLYRALGGGWQRPGEERSGEIQPADTDAAAALPAAR